MDERGRNTDREAYFKTTTENFSASERIRTANVYSASKRMISVA